MDPRRSHLPPTPDSPRQPTILPHVQEYLSPLALSDNEPIKLPVTAPPTPPNALLTGLNVLLHERDALASLHNLYLTDPGAQAAFQSAVAAIASTVRKGGRLVVCGVGKSAKVGQKLVASCNSLQVRASWLHAVEAVHGDLGMLSDNDTLLFLTFSSTTPELLALLPHIPSYLPLIALTGFTPSAKMSDCPLFALRTPTTQADSPETTTGPWNILLPAPIPVSEIAAFGVAAPTTSTAVALALCDALALSVAEEIHRDSAGGIGGVFRKFHPGGAIGKSPR